MAITKLSFKEYLASKDRLEAALRESPIYTATYSMRKYCKLPLGESKKTKETVSLKPRHKVMVQWQYIEEQSPKILKIMFEGVEDVDSSKEFQTMWSGDRFQKWLLKNTREEN